MKKSLFILLLCSLLCFGASAQEYVDLGLSVRWATSNLGANSPEQSGTFYTWVEAMGTPQDIITQTYGEGWRMPTEAEWLELINGCNWSIMFVNGAECLVGEPKARGYSSQHIYLKVAGYKWQSHSMSDGACYWTGTGQDNTAKQARGGYVRGGAGWSILTYEQTSYKVPIRGVRTAMIQTPQAVDMGNGLYWGNANIGAIDTYDAGFYFAWGDTEGSRHGELNFGWERYAYCNDSYNALTKYNSLATMGTTDNRTSLVDADDAANDLLGSGWRMPTPAEVSTLEDRTLYTWEWFDEDNTEYYGHTGYKVTSKQNGNSIFLPAAGYYVGNHVEGLNSYGSYWTNQLNTTIPYQAETMCFDGVSQCAGYGMRCEGRVIRAVKMIQ